MWDYSTAAEELLRGAYDLHVHSLPSVFAREQDGMEIIREAGKAGRAGVLLKSHYEPTALRAELINRYSGSSAKAYGGLVLNWPVGGLNAYAVEEAARAGAKIIWMPTRDAANSLVFGNMEGDFFRRSGISVTDENDNLKDCVYDIMDIVKKADIFLATGHLSVKESILLCREGRMRGVNMIFTHPEFPRTFTGAEVQKELAGMGVLIEKNWLDIVIGQVTAEEMAFNIREVGTARCYISTDRGQKNGGAPVREMKRFIEELLKAGITEEEIRDLANRVPESIAERNGTV